MSESQSRYGIMESLNQKKLEARNKIANIEKQLKQTEIDYKSNCQTLKQAIDSENSTYKDKHALWKENRKIAIQMKQMEHKQAIERFSREIETMEREIVKSDETFEDDHIRKIKDLEEQKVDQDDTYKEVLELKDLDIKALKAEVEELDNAIKSLKEISSEQAKQ